MSTSVFAVVLLLFYARNCFCDELPPDAYRLPQSIFPELYELNIFTHINDPKDGFKFYGYVRIKVNVVEDTTNITLHAKNLKIPTERIVIHKVNVDGSLGEQLSLKRSELLESVDFLVIHTNDILEKHSQYDISIPFGGELSNGLYGYYRSSYVDRQSNETRWIAVTQFEATYARAAFPCFDEPEMKSKFDISLGHHKNYTALSNMPRISSKPISNQSDQVMDRFKVTVPMSTYLVAYTINDFEFRESKSDNDVVFRIWARRDAITQVEHAKVIGPNLLKYYEQVFAIKYPLEKMDMIALPDFDAGAMENWGLITFREELLLFEPNVSSYSSQYYVSWIVGHELAHQWFGNLVTMKWWDDLWLNEGFATYVATVGVHHLNPEDNSFEDESLKNAVSVFELDALRSSHPVSVKISNPSEIFTIFDEISYNKGSCIIRMMYLFLGEKVFFGGVSKYLNKYRYKNAEQDNLWTELTEEAHRNKVLENKTVKQIMDTWTLQTGYPVVYVKVNYINNSAEVTQYRFLNDQSQPINVSDSQNPCWWVPLTYTTERELDFIETEPKAWLECDTRKRAVRKTLVDLPKSDEWIIFNTKIAGLYKVRYDEHNWNLLIKQLNGSNYNKISTLNRAVLINDALDLAWNGDQNYSIALNLLDYLKNEKEYLPWTAAFSKLSNFHRMLKLTSQYDTFKQYYRKIVSPIYKYLGGLNAKRKPTDSLDLINHRDIVSSVACRFGVNDCQEQANSFFNSWMVAGDPDESNPIPSDLRSVVYCTAIRLGGEREWEFLWQRYIRSNVGSEKSLILSSLGCTQDKRLLQRYLNWTLDESSGIRPQDRLTVFIDVAANDGLLLAKSFLFDNIDVIYNSLQSDVARLSQLVDAISVRMIGTKEYDEFQNLFKNKTKIFNQISRNTEQALETIRDNVRWQKQNYEEIVPLLKAHSESRSSKNTVHINLAILSIVVSVVSMLYAMYH